MKDFKHGDKLPKWTGETGCLYILESETLVKVGASASPESRILSQKTIGSQELIEPVIRARVSAPIPYFRTAEKQMHAAAVLGRRFQSINRLEPREIYMPCMTIAFQRAIEALECGNFESFNGYLQVIRTSAEMGIRNEVNRMRFLLLQKAS